MFPLRCATAEYYLTVWAVKYHFRDIAKFKILKQKIINIFCQK